jgi:hypothetical protein
MPLLFFPFFLSFLLPWHGAAFYKEIACYRLLSWWSVMPSRDAHAVQAGVWCPRCCLEELLGVLSRCRRCCRLLSSSCCPLQVLPGMLSKCRRCCRSCRLLSSSCCPCCQVLQSVVVVQVLSMLSSRLGFRARGVLLDVICCWRGV